MEGGKAGQSPLQNMKGSREVQSFGVKPTAGSAAGAKGGNGSSRAKWLEHFRHFKSKGVSCKVLKQQKMGSDQKVSSMSDLVAVVPGGAESTKLCLEGNKTLERGATMHEVSEAIKTMRQGKAPAPASTSD